MSLQDWKESVRTETKQQFKADHCADVCQFMLCESVAQFAREVIV